MLARNAYQALLLLQQLHDEYHGNLSLVPNSYRGQRVWDVVDALHDDLYQASSGPWLLGRSPCPLAAVRQAQRRLKTRQEWALMARKRFTIDPLE